ncbi:MAG: hypothetical protein ABMA64_07070 [Myxococcota bacterium]
MARQVKGKVTVIVDIDEMETGVGANGDTTDCQHRIEYNWTFDSGTTDGTQIDRVWSTAAALSTTPEDTDLSGTLPSVLNGSNTVVLADLVGIVVANDTAAGGGDAQVGAGGSPVVGFHASGNVEAVKPQGLFLWIAPYGTAITAATADILRMVASAGSVARRAIVFGRSA